MSNAKYIVVIVIIGVILVIGAVMLGKSDSGEINVNEAISNANQINSENGNVGEDVSAVRQDLRDLPNGGLVPQDPKSASPTPEPEPEPEPETDPEDEESGDSNEEEDVVSEPEPEPEV